MPFSNQDARLCMALSDLAYETDEGLLRKALAEDWTGDGRRLPKPPIELLETLNESVPLGSLFKSDKVFSTDTQAFFARSAGTHYIAFRGSEANFNDWLTDFAIDQDAEQLADGDRVHQGFYKALNGPVASAKIGSWLKAAEGQPLFVTGHSLGGALAALLIALHAARVTDCYTFGQPRLGGLNPAKGERIHRIINKADVVPRVPFDLVKALKDITGDVLHGGLAGLANDLTGIVSHDRLVTKLNYVHIGTAYVFGEDGSLTKNGENAYLEVIKASIRSDAKKLLKALRPGGHFGYSGNLISDHFRGQYVASLSGLKD